MQEIKERLKGLYHKEGVNKDDWDHVHPNLVYLAGYVLDHTDTYGLPMVITSIIRPKIPGVSKTDIHAKKRAFDISVKGWSVEDIEFLVNAVNEKLTIGAISIRDGKEREAVYEDGVSAGRGAHLHFQVRP